MTLSAPPTHHVVDSPIGPLTVVAEGGTITGLYMDQQRHRPDAALLGDADPGMFDAAPFDAVTEQLGAYFAGRSRAFDLPLAAVGTAFQRAVWAELGNIPYGQTVSYGEMARRIGRPSASRAVGMAIGRNPIGIIVPCHRVVGTNGKLTGYAGGTERKQHLLSHERATLVESLSSDQSTRTSTGQMT